MTLPTSIIGYIIYSMNICGMVTRFLCVCVWFFYRLLKKVSILVFLVAVCSWLQYEILSLVRKVEFFHLPLGVILKAVLRTVTCVGGPKGFILPS